MSPPEVQRCREINLGDRGGDVVAVKRALSRAGFMNWGNFTPLWGAGAVMATRSFQMANGIAPASGSYGPKTHTALVKAHRKSSTEFAFDDYSVNLMSQYCTELATMSDAGIRHRIVAEAARLYAHKEEIDYGGKRPVLLQKEPPVIPPVMDCSDFITVCHFVGGAPDPNGRNYDGHGYTGTLVNTGAPCAQDELQPGDVVFYGKTTVAKPAFPKGSPTHVSLYDGDGGVYSQGGPNRTDRMTKHPVNYRMVHHYHHYDIHR